MSSEPKTWAGEASAIAFQVCLFGFMAWCAWLFHLEAVDARDHAPAEQTETP